MLGEKVLGAALGSTRTWWVAVLIWVPDGVKGLWVAENLMQDKILVWV